jgi:hypothetical protein
MCYRGSNTLSIFEFISANFFKLDCFILFNYSEIT